MKSNPIWRNIIIITGPLTIGIMNTLLLKKEDIGTWKNYLGILILMLGIMNLIMAFVTNLSQKLKEKTKNVIFKIVAVVIPFYFIYYWQLHEKQQNKEVKILWKYVMIGFFIYCIFICGVSIKNKF